MKRLFCLIFTILLFITCFSACSGGKSFPEDITCEDILNEALSTENPPESEKQYIKSQGNLDALSMGLWADGLYKECAELELLGDYAIYLGAGVKTYEITILKAENKKDVNTLVDLIERRKKTLELGDKGMYDPDFEVRMSNALVYKDGLFVIFLITEDNDAVYKAIRNLKE